MTIDIVERARSSRSGSKMMHGGYTDAPAPTPDQRAALDALVDTLIPVEDGWPDAAGLRIADTIAIYLVPDGDVVPLYPKFRASEFLPQIVDLMASVVDQGLDERIARVREFEEREPALFARVRDFVYYAYYGSTSVVAEIRQRTRYGGDYTGRPQPDGYVDSLETWGTRSLTRLGAFIPTNAVLRAPQAGSENPS